MLRNVLLYSHSVLDSRHSEEAMSRSSSSSNRRRRTGWDGTGSGKWKRKGNVSVCALIGGAGEEGRERILCVRGVGVHCSRIIGNEGNVAGL